MPTSVTAMQNNISPTPPCPPPLTNAAAATTNNINNTNNSNSYNSNNNKTSPPPLPSSSASSIPHSSHLHNISTANSRSAIVSQWCLPKSSSLSPQIPLNLPWALDHVSDFVAQLADRKCRIVFFLDYDGTLSPIVDDPDSATIPPPIRTALSQVSTRFTTAIVTGRSKKKVMDMVKLDHLIYAASHGFDIHSPDGRVSHLVACEFIPTMKRVAHDLRILSDRFPGTHVEDNFLSVTLHFRHVHSSLKLDLLSQVNSIATRYGVRRHDGKMVHELRPPTDWHKGKAVDYLLAALKLNGPDVVPIYIGDDVSDESAFLAVRDRGFSVIVAEESLSRRTSADLRLRDPFEVGKFLMQFAAHDDLPDDGLPVAS